MPGNMLGAKWGTCGRESCDNAEDIFLGKGDTGARREAKEQRLGAQASLAEYYEVRVIKQGLNSQSAVTVGSQGGFFQTRVAEQGGRVAPIVGVPGRARMLHAKREW